MIPIWSKSLNAVYKCKNAHGLDEKYVKEKTVDTTYLYENKQDIHLKLAMTVRYATKKYPHYAQLTATEDSPSSCYAFHGPKSSYPHGNYLAANIGFIVSKEVWKTEHTHGRKFLTWPISPLQKGIYGFPKLSATKLKKELERRHGALKKKSTTYFHSEEALVHCMESDDFINSLKVQLENSGIQKGYKIYAIILDIHSSQYPCNDCKEAMNYLLEKSAEDKEGFLYKLKVTLGDYKFSEKRKRPYMLIRVSADMPYQGNSTQEQKDESVVAYDPCERYLLKDHQEENDRAIQELSQNKNFLIRHLYKTIVPDSFFNKPIRTRDLMQTIFSSGQKTLEDAGVEAGEDNENRRRLSENRSLPVSDDETITLRKLWGEQVSLSTTKPIHTAEEEDREPKIKKQKIAEVEDESTPSDLDSRSTVRNTK